MTMRLLCPAAVFVTVLGMSAAAYAQQGFALDRYEPAVRGSDWFALESLDLRGHLRPAAGLTLDWGHRPLVLYGANGNALAPLVRDQLFAHLGGAVVLWDRLRVGGNLPIALVDSGNDGGTTLPSPNGAHVGDLRLDADVRIFGTYHAPLTLAAGAQFFVPTGSRAGFTSDGAMRIVPRVMAAGKIRMVEYAAKLAINARLENVTFVGTPIGSEVQISASAGVRFLNEALLVGPELYGSTGISKGDAFLHRRTTPFELLVGAHYSFWNNLRAGLAVGPGLTRGDGTPAVRVLASLEWVPGVASDAVSDTSHERGPDRDEDAIPDTTDACPDEPGIQTDDAATTGCPAARVDESVEQILVLEPIKFETNSATLLPESDRILAGVAKTLREHRDMKLRIEGHTDDRGGPEYNRDLSNRRAASVVTWLVAHGVEADRLSSVGFGEEKPIHSNATEKGRLDNRRVEFHIVK